MFEEAIAISTLLLDPDCEVAETVRIADLIDNTYQARRPLRRADTRDRSYQCCLDCPVVRRFCISSRAMTFLTVFSLFS